MTRLDYKLNETVAFFSDRIRVRAQSDAGILRSLVMPFKRKSHKRDETLNALFERANEAGMDTEDTEFQGKNSCEGWRALTSPHESIEESQFWSELPPLLDPGTEKANLKKAGRAERKRRQLQSLATLALQVAQDGDVVVDFGAGSGHLGLLIAVLNPTCQVRRPIGH